MKYLRAALLCILFAAVSGAVYYLLADSRQVRDVLVFGSGYEKGQQGCKRPSQEELEGV